MREKTCCFTGHRIIRSDQLEIVSARTENTIRELITRDGMRCFRVGGAQGYDTMAANILFRLQATDFPDIQVILVYPFDGFTSRWTDAQKAIYDRMLSQYDKCICVSPESSREAFLARDRHLVDHSSLCIAYCIRNHGGAAYTIRYAQSKGIPVRNIAFNENTHIQVL